MNGCLNCCLTTAVSTTLIKYKRCRYSGGQTKLHSLPDFLQSVDSLVGCTWEGSCQRQDPLWHCRRTHALRFQRIITFLEFFNNYFFTNKSISLCFHKMFSKIQAVNSFDIIFAVHEALFTKDTV